MPKRVFITVAEVSGDKHAAELIRALRLLDPTIEIEAHGGALMASAGATIHHETVTGAAMTLHAIKRVFEISRLLKWTKQYFREWKPDLNICVDSSGMNLHFAQAAKEAGIPVLYYIAPQLWASREGRMKKVRAYVDRLACILPFEEEYFRKHGVNATFVGHPLFDELPRDRVARDASERFPNRPLVIGIVPGSRKSEVEANLPQLAEGVLPSIFRSFPDARFLVPTTTAVDSRVRQMLLPRDDFPEHLKALASRVEIKKDAFDEFIPQCDLVLTKSGTSTLHVAAFNVPMIVVYRVNPILWHLIGKRLIKTKKIALVNILAGQTDLVPEFIPWSWTGDVTECALDLLNHSEKLEAQRAKLASMVESLDRQGASMNVAKIAMEMINGASAP